MPRSITPKSALGKELYKALEQQGLTAQQLAHETDVVYETIRKVIAGEQPPGKKLLRDICSILHLDFDTTYEILVQEKLQKKYPGILAHIAHKNAELQPIEDCWPTLTRDQKDHVLWLVSSFSSKNITQKKTAAKATQLSNRRSAP